MVSSRNNTGVDIGAVSNYNDMVMLTVMLSFLKYLRDNVLVTVADTVDEGNSDGIALENNFTHPFGFEGSPSLQLMNKLMP